MLSQSPKLKAMLAVFLIVFAASFGISARLFVEGVVGTALFALTRVWMLALPALWINWVEHGKLGWSPPSKQESLTGATLGMLMFGVILSAYWLVGRQWIDPDILLLKVKQIGLDTRFNYLLSAFYFVVINAFVEEYIWRWFIGRQCEVFLSKRVAILFSAVCFTLHHIIALVAYTHSWPVVIVGSLGVLLAGVVWSWCYLFYRSLWACYISHLLADLAIALIGWELLFTQSL